MAQGQPSRIVRVMALDYALAHKLAAWNERRLLRDLYDGYFLAGRLGETPVREVLDQRLALDLRMRPVIVRIAELLEEAPAVRL